MSEQEIVRTTIKDMVEGQIGYTVPWAVYTVPNNLRLMALAVRGDYVATNVISGTRNMRIEMRKGVVAIDTNAIDTENLYSAPIALDWAWLAAIPLVQEA